ncbi:hydroxyacid oxidase 1-like [Asterias rubens]|uniref:hydroxyacid oxidase 1-like n=1 Tax=Asterias rubens TaxID=7604 RepID=UPI0014558262|nr:hydroxyacid oxidase 1-like [Asterias rubens]
MAADESVCVVDFEPYLKRGLEATWYDYYSNGAGEGQTHRDNVKAFLRYRLRPRYLRDVSNRVTRTSILGLDIEFPVGVSPTATHGVIHGDGEKATARAAASAGTVMVLSLYSSKSLEDVAASVPEDTLLFMQLNILRSRVKTEEIIKRVDATGRYKALVVTIDQPVYGRKRAQPLNALLYAKHTQVPNILNHPGETWCDSNSIDPACTWDDIKWLQGVTSLPIILKGILTAESAKMAASLGAAGILVSNHGGRQLDGVAATIDSLSEVVEAVKGSNVEVYLDGGVRKGTDVLKALAMGARAVFIGRPALWGLAYNGEAGVRKVLDILKDEFSLAMALAGCSSVAEITPDLVKASPYGSL